MLELLNQLDGFDTRRDVKVQIFVLRLRYSVCSLIIHEILFYYFCEAQLVLLSHIKYNENIL